MPKPHGWLVRPELFALAAKLRLTSPREASRWLIRPASNAPFRETTQWGVFYSECDPRELLEPDEIMTLRRCELWRLRTAVNPLRMKWVLDVDGGE